MSGALLRAGRWMAGAVFCVIAEYASPFSCCVEGRAVHLTQVYRTKDWWMQGGPFSFLRNNCIFLAHSHKDPVARALLLCPCWGRSPPAGLTSCQPGLEATASGWHPAHSRFANSL